MTPFAVEGPLFVAVTVNVKLCVTSGAGFETVLRRPTSATGRTVVGAVAELSSGFGSVSFAETVAVFVIDGTAAAETDTTIEIVALFPAGRPPRRHVTVVVPLQPP
jgi:hypothetical protein